MIIVRWSTRSNQQEFQRVYYSKTSFDIDSLPDTYYQVHKELREYLDTTATDLTSSYYYAVSSVRGEEELVSPVVLVSPVLSKGVVSLTHFGDGGVISATRFDGAETASSTMFDRVSAKSTTEFEGEI